MRLNIALFCLSIATIVNGFTIVGVGRYGTNERLSKNTFLRYAAPEMETMNIRDIKAELKTMGVPFGDCFDRESLLCRLQEAREGKYEKKLSVETKEELNTNTNISPTSVKQQLDADSILADLRSQPLKELKIQCSRRNLRYATFLEKEDFVQAIWKDMQAVASFSVSGVLRPGKASEITGEQLDQELSSHDTPILLDVYATWCGPCKMMAPEMDKVAEEVGKKCRVAKLDSDTNPEWAARYKVQGLPTTLLIHKGQVQGRLEGAFMKDKLLELVQPYV